MTIADTLRHLGLSSPDPRSDGELVERFVRTRDEAAFAELFRRHGPTVYGVCRRVVGHGPDADDAFQAVFLVFARKAGTVRPPGMVGNWLYGVAVRTANKARVMNAKRQAREERAATARERTVEPPLPGGRGSPDTLAVIDAELAALPDVYRAAFVACDLNGRTRSEAARELGWPEGTVAARVAKARELLAARLRKRGVTLGIGLFAAVAVPTATATDTLHAVHELLAVGTASAVTPTAQHLSDVVVKSMTTFHAKWLAAVGVLTLTLATGGAVLLAGGPDKTPPVHEPIKAPVPKELAVVMWKEGKPIEPENGKRITGVAYSPDGTKIALGQDRLITLIDAETQKQLWYHDSSGPATCVAFSPDGETVAATFEDGVRLINVRTGKLMGTLEEKGSAPTAVTFFPDRPTPAKELQLHQIAFGHTGKLFVKTGVSWDKASTITSSLTPKGTAPEGITALPLAVSPTGDGRAVTLGPTDRKTGRSILWAWGAGGGAESKELSGHQGRPTAAAWAADGSRIVTADDRGTLIVWDGVEFKEQAEVELGTGTTALALAPDGKTLAALRMVASRPESELEQTNFELFVFDITDPPAKPKPMWTTEKPFSWGFAGPAGLAFSPDGKTLLAAFADPYYDVTSGGKTPKSSGVRVWTLGEGKIKAPVPKPVETEWKEGKTIELKNPAPVQTVAFSTDGSTVIVGQSSEVIAVDAKTREERLILKIKEAENHILSIRYKPDGTQLGIANWNSYGLAGTKPKDGTTDYTTWAGQMTNVAFSPDGTRLAASDGRTVKVHSVPRKEKEEPLQFGPLGDEESKEILPSAIAFSPKGDQLLLLPNFRVPADWQYDPKAGFTVPDPKAATHWVAVVWSLKGNEVKVLKHGKARITAADWSADGQRMVTADDDGTVIVWDTDEFKEKSRMELRVPVIERVLAPKPVSQLALAPDGKTLAVVTHHRAATGGPDRPSADTNQFELLVFDVTNPPKDPKPVWAAQKPFVSPVSVAFAPDGKTLLVVVTDTFMVVPGVGEKLPPSKVTVLELVPKK